MSFRDSIYGIDDGDVSEEQQTKRLYGITPESPFTKHVPTLLEQAQERVRSYAALQGQEDDDLTD